MTSPSPASYHVPVRPEWLAQTQEDVVDPDVAVIDAHHHLWHEDNPYHRFQYLLSELRSDLASGHRVVATVYVEGHAMYRREGAAAMAPVGETEFVVASVRALPASDSNPCRPCAAIVGHADLLRLGASVRPVLEAHVEAGAGRFRGIRQITAWHVDPTVKGTVFNPPPGMLGDAKFREGFACLEGMGLSFDSWQYFTQLDDLIDLADAFPGTVIVIDHVGGLLGIGPYAGRRDEVFHAWRERILRAALRPNMRVKLSGLGMRSTGFGLHEREKPASSTQMAEAWRPYFDTCIQAFGPGRCMFASNFPVDKCAFGARVLWNAHKKVAAAYSPPERDALLGGTAEAVYRMQEER